MELPLFNKLIEELYDERLQEWKKLNKELLTSLSVKESISIHLASRTAPKAFLITTTVVAGKTLSNAVPNYQDNMDNEILLAQEEYYKKLNSILLKIESDKSSLLQKKRDEVISSLEQDHNQVMVLTDKMPPNIKSQLYIELQNSLKQFKNQTQNLALHHSFGEIRKRIRTSKLNQGVTQLSKDLKQDPHTALTSELTDIRKRMLELELNQGVTQLSKDLKQDPHTALTSELTDMRKRMLELEIKMKDVSKNFGMGGRATSRIKKPLPSSSSTKKEKEKEKGIPDVRVDIKDTKRKPNVSGKKKKRNPLCKQRQKTQLP
ncbi:hypothetical protein Zmor_012061 [Zophobas morio]|uniref:Uncharacterized protein n=1 Tax=Zophobas morio TaxID=2755281 RepID=A0AA38LZJ0_9CUCU|nr:hypothetical protein Zmor_012061 [Zophobas morio]